MNCDRIARSYRWLEYLTFGRALHRRRCALLEEISSPRSVLILGDGDGRFTAELLCRYTEAVVDSIESSRKMAQLAALRIATCPNGGQRVRQIRGDARLVALTQSYDLVVTHFFLDCFTTEDVEELISRTSSRLLPGGRWLVSEFQIPSRGLPRFAAALVIKALYLSFRMLTGIETTRLPDYAKAFESQRFRRTVRETAAGGMLISELWEKG